MRHLRPFSILFLAALVALPALAAPLSATEIETAAEMEKININTATLKELTQLDRLGPALAGRIVEYRDQHGPFKSVEEITKVSGIGPKTLELISGRIILEDAKPGGASSGKAGTEKKADPAKSKTAEKPADSSPDTAKPAAK